MKKTRRHRRMLAAVRTVSFVMTTVMLFTLFPAMNALGEDVAQESEPAKSVSTAAELSEQTFELEPEDGVTVTLTGLMPTDGYAKAKTVTVAEEDVLHAYDITIYYRNGKEFEPDEGSPISVCFNSKAIADAIKDEDVSLEAKHIADDGKTESIALTSAAGGEAVFEAKSFSIYLIKEHDEKSEDTATPRVFYHFLSQNYTQVEDGEDIYYTAGAYSFPNKYNEMVDTQIIKNGEKLQEVVIPENNDAGMFYGWYRVHLREENNGVYSYDWGTGTPERREFNTAVTVPTSSEYNGKDQHIYLAPLYGHYRFLTFHQNVYGSEGGSMILARKLVVLNDDHEARMKISDVRAPSTDPNKIVFWGWKFDHTGLNDPYHDGPAETPTVEIQRTVNDDDSEVEAYVTVHDEYEIKGVQPGAEELKKMIFDIWPEFREARWFYFDTGGNGADYVPARFVMVGEETDCLSSSSVGIPTRPGYNFAGWYCRVEKDGQIYDIRVTDNFNTFNSTDLNPSGYDDGDGDPNKLTLNPGVSIQIKNGTKVLIMDDPPHPDLSEQYFYAKWNSKYLANYQVIIWKQKITDLKDTPDAQKIYDFEARYLIEDVRPNFSDADLTQEFIDGHYTSMNYEGFTCNTNQTKIVNGVGTNKKKVNSDGSTIVNVYYDRIDMKITFFYRASDLSGESYETVGQDIYVKTDSNGRKPQYGKVNGEYVQLTSQENAEATYIYPYSYSASDNTDATMFGIVATADGKQEYVKLERKEVYSWKKSGYLYTPTTITTSTSTSTSSPTRSQYVTYNGGFSTIYSIRTKLYYNNKVY